MLSRRQPVIPAHPSATFFCAAAPLLFPSHAPNPGHRPGTAAVLQPQPSPLVPAPASARQVARERPSRAHHPLAAMLPTPSLQPDRQQLLPTVGQPGTRGSRIPASQEGEPFLPIAIDCTTLTPRPTPEPMQRPIGVRASPAVCPAADRINPDPTLHPHLFLWRHPATPESPLPMAPPSAAPQALHTSQPSPTLQPPPTAAEAVSVSRVSCCLTGVFKTDL